MKTKLKVLFTTALAATMLLLTILSATSANAANNAIVIEKLKIDNTEVLPEQNNLLNLVRENEFKISVWLHSTVQVKNARIVAELNGYEYESDEPVSAKTPVFDMKANTTYAKTLLLKIPERMESTAYKLKIRLVDANSNTFEQEYNIFIDKPRHELKIADVIFQPNFIKAGEMLLAKVRIKNKGQKAQEDIKVSLKLPALNTGASAYIEEVLPEQEEQTEEIAINIPKCAAPGKYIVEIEALYDSGSKKTSTQSTIEILENDACKPASTKETVTLIVQESGKTSPETAQQDSTAKVRSVLEAALFTLLGLLVIAGIVLGITELIKNRK